MSGFDKAFVNITPDMGNAIMLQAFGGAHLQTVSYQKVEDATDSITRLLLTGKMESMVHPFACDFFHLTGLEPVEYSFLLQGLEQDGSPLSLSFKATPKKSVETPELVSLVGTESELKAQIKLKTENEGGTVVFFLVNAEGTITEYRQGVAYVSLDEVHEIIITDDILPHGQTFEVSMMMEAERGPTAMTTPRVITMTNKPDSIDVEKTEGGDELVVDKPNDYSADFKLDIEASKFSAVDIDDRDALDSLLLDLKSAHHERPRSIGPYMAGHPRTRHVNHAWAFRQHLASSSAANQLFDALLLYWDGSEWVRGAKVTSIGTRMNNGDYPVHFNVDTINFTGVVVFVQPVVRLEAVFSQVDAAFTGLNGTQHYIKAADFADMGEYVSVRARWTNISGSSAWSADNILRSFTPAGFFAGDLKVIPSIADKILSFKVAGRTASSGLKVIGAVRPDPADIQNRPRAIVEYANKVDGRIVNSFPADQDLSAISASQAISAELAYENGDAVQFAGQLNIPRIEAAGVSINATEVLTLEGGQVIFTFADLSTYHDGASRTSVTINETAISEEDFIPANTSGSTDFQLKSVQYSLPAASIAATNSMDALSDIADWQLLPTFTLDPTVHTHTAVSSPTAATLAIEANGLDGQVIGVITPGATGNQTLYYTQVRYDDGTNTAQTPYIVQAGPGVTVTGIVWDSYQYTQADGSIYTHEVGSVKSNEAHGMTAPILGAVSISGKQLSIPYKSGGKIGEDHKLSLFVFAYDEDGVSPADVASGRGSFHRINSITPSSLTAEITYTSDFSNFSSSISKFMVVLSRASDNTAASIDGMS